MSTVPLIKHLAELRKRCLYVFLCWCLMFIVCVIYARDLYSILAQPLLQVLPENGHLIAVDVASPFIAPLRLSLWISVFLTLPFFFYQTWMFVIPGLYPKERLFVLPIFAVTVFLFFIGALFVYYVVLPLALAFFHRIGPQSVLIMTDINRYLSFVIRLIFAFGVTFELPVVIFLTTRIGLVKTQTLRRYRRHVIVLCFVCGMLLTPPDVFSQLILALPLYILFEVGLLVADLFPKADRDAALIDVKDRARREKH